MNFNFEFDPQKSASNKSKHGIDFSAVQALWSGRVEIFLAATTHGETRYVNLGKIGDTYWTAIVIYRGAICRIISVYRSTPQQIALYERSKKPR